MTALFPAILVLISVFGADGALQSHTPAYVASEFHNDGSDPLGWKPETAKSRLCWRLVQTTGQRGLPRRITLPDTPDEPASLLPSNQDKGFWFPHRDKWWMWRLVPCRGDDGS